MSRLTFTVDGIPAAQGSKSARAIYKGRGKDRVFTGRVAQVEKSEKVKPWRKQVKEAAQAAHLASDEWDKATDAVGVEVTFRFARPAKHYRTGRNAHILRDDAPVYLITLGKGDLDKLQRSTFDALTEAEVISDDCIIVAVHAFKRFAEPGETPGASIQLYTVNNRVPGLPPVYRGQAVG